MPETPVEGVEGAEDHAPTRPERDPEQGIDPAPPSPRPDPAAAEVWERVLEDAQGDIVDVSSLRVWFDGITPVGLQDDVLSVAVPNSFAKEYIETRFGELLEASLKERLSKKASLMLIVAGAQAGR